MEKRCPVSSEGSSTPPDSVKNVYEKTIVIAKGNSSLGKLRVYFFVNSSQIWLMVSLVYSLFY